MQRDQTWFLAIGKQLPATLDLDHRCHTMLAIGNSEFGSEELALRHAKKAAELAIHDQIPARVAARLLVEAGELTEAAGLLEGNLGSVLDSGSVETALAQLPQDGLPLYYTY